MGTCSCLCSLLQNHDLDCAGSFSLLQVWEVYGLVASCSLLCSLLWTADSLSLQGERGWYFSYAIVLFIYGLPNVSESPQERKRSAHGSDTQDIAVQYVGVGTSSNSHGSQ